MKKKKIEVFKIGIMCLCGKGQSETTGTITNREIGSTSGNTKYLVQPNRGNSRWVTKRSLGFLNWSWEDSKFQKFEDKLELVDPAEKI